MKTRRALFLKGLGKYIEIDKVTEVTVPSQDKEFIYIEKRRDGKWLLAYTTDTIPDIGRLEALEIVRDDDWKTIKPKHTGDDT